ncbi:MAG: hypothetical protein CM1200mP29_02230 [Verrucomicrobiota bacterium]|nr:MAG: hypothetical protein CM1200mP29_02230 [Verrucomicrobiota bacterium]
MRQVGILAAAAAHALSQPHPPGRRSRKLPTLWAQTAWPSCLSSRSIRRTETNMLFIGTGERDAGDLANARQCGYSPPCYGSTHAPCGHESHCHSRRSRQVVTPFDRQSNLGQAGCGYLPLDRVRREDYRLPVPKETKLTPMMAQYPGVQKSTASRGDSAVSARDFYECSSRVRRRRVASSSRADQAR